MPEVDGVVQRSYRQIGAGLIRSREGLRRAILAALRSDHRLFRTTSVWWVFAAFYGFLFFVAGRIALDSDGPIAERIVFGVLAALIAVWMAYSRGAGLRVNNQGVKVVRYSGINRFVAWDQINDFELTPNGKGGVYVAVVLNDGERLTTQGLCGASASSSTANDAVSDLRALRSLVSG